MTEKEKMLSRQPYSAEDMRLLAEQHLRRVEENLTDLAKKTTPQHVVLPFKDFVGKNGGTFHPERLQHFAIYCNTVGDEPVDSHFYLDDIRAIRQ